MKLRIPILTLAMLAAYSSLPAQTVTVSGSYLQDSSQNLMSGTICFQAVNTSGHSISYRAPGGGQVAIQPVCAAVLNGVFTIGLPDTTLTSPANICFQVSVQTSKGTALGPGYSCVQPHGTAVGDTDWCQAGACNFDDYTPNLPALPIAYVSPDLMSAWNVQVALDRLTQRFIDSGLLIVPDFLKAA
jgi:hypothetical protein